MTLQSADTKTTTTKRTVHKNFEVEQMKQH